MVLHTAHPRVGALRTAMPSPSAKLKAARRLPKHLRVFWEAPSGPLLRLVRRLRGEFCRAGQHSGSSSCSGDEWPKYEAGAGAVEHCKRLNIWPEKAAPTAGPAGPPAASASMESQQLDHIDTSTRSQPSSRPTVDSDMNQTDRDMVALKTEDEAHEPSRGNRESTTVIQAQTRDSAYAIRSTAAGSRSSAPDSSSEELVEVEETTAARSQRGLDSATQVRERGEAHAAQSTAAGSRFSAPCSNSEELVEIEVAVDDERPCSHLDSQLDSNLLPLRRVS